ncbi:hypothetical protein OEZ85_005633 [Tetradesmus obliquus]|uniref:Uncharacterized protein n=1 Tax=Tetradesmus obliquus TaxID=3088 RepID=A0ABY8UEK7_TETOB|nr:hypothetical protein OEZ85_005633 [Tetradesmus obliquus]
MIQAQTIQDNPALLSRDRLRAVLSKIVLSKRVECSYSSNTQQQHELLQQLPARFPACSTLQYTAVDGPAIGHFADLLPALVRLPQLSQLKLKLTTQAASAAIPAAYAVDAARLQLSGVTACH